jgi:acyl-coenzyme A thioesterase PaaI-like protein
MSTQDNPLQPDFRERAKANDVAVARLIGFEATEIADGHATVTLAAGPQHANPMGTLHGGILCEQRGRTIGYLECTITDEENRMVAKATSTCMVLRGQKAAGR